MDLPSTWTTTQLEEFKQALGACNQIKLERQAGTLTDERKHELRNNIRTHIWKVRCQTAEKYKAALQDVEKWEKLMKADTLDIKSIKTAEYDDIAKLGDIQEIRDIRKRNREALVHLNSIRNELAYDASLAKIETTRTQKR